MRLELRRRAVLLAAAAIVITFIAWPSEVRRERWADANDKLAAAVRSLDSPEVSNALSMGADPTLNLDGGRTKWLTYVRRVILPAARQRRVSGEGSVLMIALGAKGNENERNAVIKALLVAGADVTVRDDAGHTPLMLACISFRYSTSRLLLAAHQDLNATDDNGGTALDYADAGSCFNDHGVVAELKKRGARYGSQRRQLVLPYPFGKRAAQ